MRRPPALTTAALMLALLMALLTAPPTGGVQAQAVARDRDPVDLDEVVRILATEADGVTPVDPVTLVTGALKSAAAAIAPLTYRLQGAPASPLLSVSVGRHTREVSLTRRAGLPATGLVLERLRDFIHDALPPEDRSAPLNALLADGLVRALDPHGALLSATAYGDFQSRAAGREDGQGILFGHRQGQLMVEAVLPDSPAARAGVLPGERVLQIGPYTALELSLEEALALVRGPVGSNLPLLMLPEGSAAPRERLLKRGRLRVSSVEGRVIRLGARERIGYLRLRSFQDRTSAELREALNRFRQTTPGLLGLVLDLRDNHGGVLEQAIRVADQFLERGTIVTLSGPRIPSESVPARWYRSVTSAPLVVLVNGGTASAAEVLAGALKRNHRAVLLGKPTFGKDSIQSVFPLTGGHALKITVGHYRTAERSRSTQVRVNPHVAFRPVRFTEAPGLVGGLPATALQGEDGADAQPLRELPYLVVPDTTAADRFGGVTAETDYVLASAVRLLQQNAPQGPTALLGTALDWVQRERRRQDRAIAEQLAARRVDWSAGPGTGGGRAMVTETVWSARLAPDAPWVPYALDEPLPPGAVLRLAVTVANRGSAALHRLVAVGRAEVPWLNGLELPFGRVDPGREARATVQVTPPADQPPGVESVRLNLLDGRGQAHEGLTVQLPLAPSPPGRLELAVQALDNGRAGSRGNRDGRLQAGERIALRIVLHNVGAGATGDGRVWVSGADGRRLRGVRTWAAFGGIPAGGAATVELAVEADPALGFAPAVLELNVMDERMGPSLQRHRIPLTAGHPLPALALRPPRIRMEPLPGTQETGRLDLRGRIVDDKALHDVRIYRNGHKVFFADANTARELTVAPPVPLEPGRNLIRIVARDGAGLLGVEEHVLWQGLRPPTAGTAAPLGGWHAAAAIRFVLRDWPSW